MDECQEIELFQEDVQKIIDAVNADSLPHTEGFFFGKSDGSEKEETLQILTKALEWMRLKENDVSRYVVYRASW